MFNRFHVGWLSNLGISLFGIQGPQHIDFEMWDLDLGTIGTNFSNTHQDNLNRGNYEEACELLLKMPMNFKH